MRARKLNTQIRKEQIARAALDLIGRGGLQGLSIAAIARRVGLVPSAIYRHFKSKGHVLDAIPDLFREALLGNVRVVREASSDALEHLRQLLAQHVRLIRENRGIPRGRIHFMLRTVGSR